MAKNKGCQVFIPDPKDARYDIECGEESDGEITVQLPTHRGMASVRVCTKHRKIINSQAAKMRAEAKVNK